MGTRGPTRRPADVTALSGNRAKRNRRAATGPRPILDAPVPPDEISAEALEVWRRVTEAMAPSRTITAADTDVLFAYCETRVAYGEALRIYRSTGFLVVGRNRGGDRFVKSPMHQIVRDLANQLRQYARELGLSPIARAGIELPALQEPGSEQRFFSGGA